MSKVKIQGNASGTGVVTLTAPNTNTDRTITLPDGDITLGGGVDGIVSTANATAITIDASENVGFGVTPTSFYSGYTGLQLGGNGAFYGQTSAGADKNLWLSQNARAGTDGSEKAISTGTSSQVMMASGNVTIKTGASASADANVSWTTNLDIKADGRGLSQFTAKAWVSINGTAPSVRDSHNVSSISRPSIGLYTINFTNSMANTNYAWVYGGGDTAGAETTFQGGSAVAVGSHSVQLKNAAGTVTSRPYITGVYFGD